MSENTKPDSTPWAEQSSPPAKSPDGQEPGAMFRKVLAALERLPRAHTWGGSAAVEVRARGLIKWAPRPQSTADQQFLLRREVVGAKATRRELDAVKQAADKLRTAIEEMHAPARQALGFDDGPGGAGSYALEAALAALAERITQCELPELPANAGRGRKRAEREASLTSEIAKVYWRHTGQVPTIRTDYETGKVYGPFFEFVGDIFAALGVTASPESQARAAVAEWRKLRRKIGV